MYSFIFWEMELTNFARKKNHRVVQTKIISLVVSIMNSSQVAEGEELSEPKFTDYANSDTFSKSRFISSVIF